MQIACAHSSMCIDKYMCTHLHTKLYRHGYFAHPQTYLYTYRLTYTHTDI